MAEHPPANGRTVLVKLYGLGLTIAIAIIGWLATLGYHDVTRRIELNREKIEKHEDRLDFIQSRQDERIPMFDDLLKRVRALEERRP